MIPTQRLSAVRADSRVLFISEDRKVEASAQNLPTGVDRIEGDASGVTYVVAAGNSGANRACREAVVSDQFGAFPSIGGEALRAVQERGSERRSAIELCAVEG